MDIVLHAPIIFNCSQFSSVVVILFSLHTDSRIDRVPHCTCGMAYSEVEEEGKNRQVWIEL